ncbi:MAG: guanylate kinase [Oscillospiraceae bacterium]|nr:guanylate kinase [Oscillospiraceae bacterium]
MMNKGLLIVISGPSGCGKGTVLSEILKDDKFFYSISATTRNPRPGEIDGVNYHFLTKDKFEELIANDGMLEYASYCDNYYGTPRKPVEDMLNEGKHVILEIEVQGAMKIKEKCPEAKFIFILPPSLQELKRRLNKRGTESAEVIGKRLNEAVGEIEQSYKYDYALVNGELSLAVDDLLAIIRAEELNLKNSNNIINEVLKNA